MDLLMVGFSSLGEDEGREWQGQEPETLSCVAWDWGSYLGWVEMWPAGIHSDSSPKAPCLVRRCSLPRSTMSKHAYGSWALGLAGVQAPLALALDLALGLGLGLGFGLAMALALAIRLGPSLEGSLAPRTPLSYETRYPT